MQLLIQILISICVLALGIPIGNLLAHWTKDELKSGQKWFKMIIILSLIGGVVGIILRNDVLMFSFFFIAVITSRSLRKS